MGVQRLPAGGQHVDAGAAGQQRGDELGTGGEQVFAVVQDDQQRAIAQLVDQRLAAAGRGARIQPERLGHGVGHQQRLADCRQVDEPHAVGVRRAGPPRGLQRQPGLPAAAGPGEGEQPGAVDQPLDVGELALAPDEAGQRASGDNRCSPAACGRPRGGVAPLPAEPVSSSRNTADGLGVRVGAERVEQVVDQPLVARQRLGSPTQLGQHHHLGADGSLVQRIGLQRPGEDDQAPPPGRAAAPRTPA